MLVLSRKLNETIVIGDNIRVTVVGIRPNQIRLGIEAPTEVGIYREELSLPIRTVRDVANPSSPVVPLGQSVRPGT